ncbi:MAG: RimK family alpha-L-glutamate ligase [Gemmatimonadetes bacterium]|nr:RimK family alpha-L-glutamate ligase [Gemmatimonadota bacterium]MBP9199275.1 RimK family alpha-L-glutamate ligase [Gemmatimonadales bacterium]
MDVVILASSTGWHTDELVRAVSARGLVPLLLPWEGNVGRMGHAAGVRNGAHALADARAVLPRIIPSGTLEQLIYRVDTLHRLEEDGVRVMNTARAIERTVDKAWTSAILDRAGLPTPETVACERAEDAFAAFHAMGDVVVKPLFGSMGLGMSRVSDEDMAWRVFRVIETIGGVYYLQRFVPHGGRDLRAFVVGDRVLGAIERRADGWRTNVSRGGRATATTLPAAWADLAVRAARAVGAEYAGVDLLPADDGTVYVLEVNGIPGWEGLQGATGIDVAGAVVEQLLQAGRP